MLPFLCCAALLPVQAASVMQPPCPFVPAGELAARIAMVHKRFAEGIDPAFTDKFILADVELDPAYPRRFSEFSGDISGRYIGAMAMLPPSDPKAAEKLDRLVEQVLRFQRADGRFGNDKLSFAAKDIGADQMALLWGNGRLLVGLLEYYGTKPSDKVLEASRKLGDFLLRIFDTCTKPEVIARLRGKAANGFICFTQFNEGLELLARATGDTKYRDVAARMLSLLEPRGDQHTHGYLTTLRGHMMIYESTGDKAMLDAVKARYKDIVDSGAVKINGGVMEYFKEGYNRDEGCSEADFLRLSLQLWRATGQPEYLNRAEKCLYNSFFANQFCTGDFGHHAFDGHGYITVPGPGRAWWCCTMHGLRAMRDVLDNVVTRDEKGIRVNLYIEGRWDTKDAGLCLERRNEFKGAVRPAFRITIERPPAPAPKSGVVDILFPFTHWMTESDDIVRSGDQTTGEGYERCVPPVRPASDNAIGWGGYGLKWRAGDTIDIGSTYAWRFVGRDGKIRTVDQLSADKPQEAAIFYGPWLMGVDAEFNPMFHGEPFEDNVLLLPDWKTLSQHVTFVSGGAPLESGPRITLTYTHGGFSDPCKVELRPVSEQTTHEQTTVSFWHKVKRASEK